MVCYFTDIFPDAGFAQFKTPPPPTFKPNVLIKEKYERISDLVSILRSVGKNVKSFSWDHRLQR